MRRRARILFVKPWDASFIEMDIEIFRKHFDLDVVLFDLRNLRKNLVKNILSIVNMTVKMLKSDIAFAWFADIHSLLMTFLAKILGKKSVVVVGGYEVARVPEINYGALLNPNTQKIVKRILWYADRIIAVSKFSSDEITRFSNEVSNKITIIYNAVDTSKFAFDTNKENLVITSTSSIDRLLIKLKGLDTFIRAAESIQHARFVV